MKVEIATEAVHFPEKEYINGIFVAECRHRKGQTIFIFGHSVLFSGTLRARYRAEFHGDTACPCPPALSSGSGGNGTSGGHLQTPPEQSRI
jgi:hypothetical protein